MFFILSLIIVIESAILPNTSKGSAILPMSSNLGVTTDYYFYIITQTSVASGNYLKISFPQEFSNINLGSGTCYIGQTSATCVQQGSLVVLVTLPIYLSSNSRYTIRVPSITNPGSALTTSYFVVAFQYSASSQLIDINDAFGTIAISAAINSISGSITAGSSQAGSVANYTFKFSIATALPIGSQFQIMIPSGYSFQNTSCSSVAYGVSVPAISGNFQCNLYNGAMVVAGLSQGLAANSQVALMLYLKNPGTVLAAGSLNFVVRSLYGYSTIILDQATIGNLQITEGSLSGISHVAYTSGTKFVTNNLVYTNLAFVTSNTIPNDGFIQVNYATTLTSGACVVIGLSQDVAGNSPTCSISGTTATISSFGAVAGGSTLKIINQLTTATVSAITITTQDSSNKNIDKSVTGGGLTADATYNSLVSASVSSTLISGRSGTLSITFTSTSTNTVTSMNFYIPSAIYPASTTLTCKLGGVTTACTFASGVLTISPSATTCNAACTVIIDSASHWVFPSLGSSSVNVLEISTLLIFASTKEYITSVLTLAPSSFSASSLFKVKTDSVWSPYIVNITLSNGLNADTSFPYFLIAFTNFDTNDLGTGYSSAGVIGCVTTGLVDYSSAFPVTCVFTPGVSSTLQVSSFKSISAGTTVTIGLVVYNPSSASSVSLTVTSAYSQYNSIITTADSVVLSLSTTGTATTWPTAQGSGLSTSLVNKIATITLTLTPTSSSSAGDLLWVVFPPGFDVSVSNSSIASKLLATTAFSNTYAPCLLISLNSNVFSSSSTSTLVITVANGPYQGAGGGNIKIGLISNSAATFVNYGTVTDSSNNALTYASATKASFAYASYQVSSTYSSAGDVLYKFYLTLNNTIPSAGKILIVFDSSVNLGTSYCALDSKLGSSATCSISGSTVTISSISQVLSGTTVYIKVLNIINPSSLTTNTITVYSLYSSTSTTFIDYSVLAATQLQTAIGAANVTIQTFSFFPQSPGSYGEMTLKFYMDASVPKTGQLKITFPGSFNLPSITSSNCIFNLEFSSCSSSGNVLTILPVTSFSAGVLMNLIVPGVTVPSSTNVGVSISSSYSGITLAQNNVSDPSAMFTASAPALNIMTPTLVLSPTNLGEVATYTFGVSANISASNNLVIWFPANFPEQLGVTYCTSTGTSRVDGLVSCYLAYNNALVASGITALNFNFTVHGINNPSASGSTGQIVLQIVNSSNTVLYSGSVSASITSAPTAITIKSISLSSFSINDLANYTFTTTLNSLPSTIWIDFPNEFTNELYGVGDTYSCSSVLSDKISGTATNWISSISCTNNQLNRISITSTGSGTVGSNLLVVTISGVKSQSFVGTTNCFRVSLLSGNSITSRSYDCSSASQVTYVSLLQPLTIQNPSAVLRMNSGVMAGFSIYTASSKIVAKSDLTFTYSISSLNPTSGLSISPSPLVMPQGTSTLTFYVSASSSVSPGNFIIKWAVNSAKYSPPKYTLLVVDPSVTYTVSVQNIPELAIGTTSIPITVTSQAAPLSTLTINVVGPAGFTFTPIVINPNTFAATYTISVGVTALSGTYQFSFSMQGDSSEVFYFDSASPYVLLNSFDVVTPSIVSFVQNSPRKKTSMSLTIQASESCMFYYTFGQRGLQVPSNNTLVLNATQGTSGYYLGIIDATNTYSFMITGLIGEHDYVLYGLLGDTSGNFMTEAFTVDLFTAEIDDSIFFTLKFLQPYPSLSQMQNDVVTALASQFVIPTSRIFFVTNTTDTATYELFTTSLTDGPSPSDLITYTAVPIEINALLSGITLDTSYDIDDSIVDIPNPRPTWVIFPTVNANSKNSITVNFSMAAPCTVHAEILGDSDTIPSSRQINLGLNAFGMPANLTFTINVNSTALYNVTFPGLEPISSYTLVMTAQNNGSPNRYMDDDFMATINFITQAGTSSTNSTNSTTSYAAVLGFQLLLGYAFLV